MNRTDFVYNYQNNVNIYSQQLSVLDSNDPDFFQKAEAINNQISNDVNELNIIVKNLEPNEKKDELLSIAMKSLASLAGELDRFGIILEEAAKKSNFTKIERSKINYEAIRVNDVYVRVKHSMNLLFKVTESMKDFKFAKTEAELKSVGDIQAANLSIQSEKKSGMDKAMGFLSGFFRAEPEVKTKNGKTDSLSKFVDKKSVDNKDTIQDVAQIMQNQEYGKMVSFKDEKGSVIFDDDGIGFSAPEVFVKDILRSDGFTLNGKQLFKKIYEVGDDPDKAWFKSSTMQTTTEGNPNSIAREMYSLFGTQGANRLLKLCFQGVVSNLQKKMGEKTFGEGEYTQILPDKLFVLINETGLTYNIELDEDDNVSVTIKYLARLHTQLENISDFTAHIPVKINIKIPLEKLLNENFDSKTGKELGIHVEETLGKLIVDDRNLAVDVLDKL